MKKQALIGTSKGLVIFDLPSSGAPRLSHIHFTGYAVNQVFADHRTGRWWVAVSHKHWGQKLHFSDDQGKHWAEAAVPSYGGTLLPDGSPARLKQIWCIAAGGDDQEKVLWLGTEPGALFKSEDYGESFQLVESLWNHPSRKDKTAWFGAGKDRPFIHTINIDPRDSRHLYVSVSSAGVFESWDSGISWNAKNNGLHAAYLPKPNAEYGHDPHRVLLHPVKPDIMWQQNHCGVYMSKDGGEYWEDVSRPKSMPYYGFALAIDEQNPARAWVIPVESDEKRIAPDLRLRVMRTDDFGKTWQDDSKGLPGGKVFDIVLRHAFDRSGETMMFGTTNGNVYVRMQENQKWELLNSHLIKVNALILL